MMTPGIAIRSLLYGLIGNCCVVLVAGGQTPSDPERLLDVLRAKDEALWASCMISVEVRSAASGWPFYDRKQGMMTRTCTLTCMDKERGITSIYRYDHPPVFSTLGARRYQASSILSARGYQSGDYDEHGHLIVWRKMERYALFAPDLNNDLRISRSNRVSREGVVIEGGPSPMLDMFPVGNEDNLFQHFNRIVLALGRGFGRSIERITEIRPLEGGLVEVHAREPYGTWTLTVDPALDYLVRAGTLVKASSNKPWVIVTTSGRVESEGLIIAERGTVTIVFGTDPLLEEVTVTRFSRTPSKNHLKELRKKITGPLPRWATIIDHRVNPPRRVSVDEDR